LEQTAQEALRVGHGLIEAQPFSYPTQIMLLEFYVKTSMDNKDKLKRKISQRPAPE
jgi:hypothetical protein